MGDFYEVFGKNAEVFASELPLTLAGRDCGLESRVPMVGFPYHASDVYFGKILSNGHTLVVMDNDDKNVILASRNIQKISTLPVAQISTYEVVANGKVVLTKGAVEKLQEVYGA